MEVKNDPPLDVGDRFRLSKNLMGGSEGCRSATSIVAADAGRALRSFRLTPPGRFGPFGAKCPGCSIIRTFLTVVLMVSLPRYGSLCHLRWQQPTGLALPSAPQGTRFPPSPPNEIRIQRHVRWIRKPCAARFRLLTNTFREVWRARRPSKVDSYRPALPGGRGVCAPGRKHFLSIWRKRPPWADFFDKLSLAQQGFLARFPGRAAGAGETCPGGKDRRRRAFSTR